MSNYAVHATMTIPVDCPPADCPPPVLIDGSLIGTVVMEPLNGTVDDPYVAGQVIPLLIDGTLDVDELVGAVEETDIDGTAGDC